MNKRLISVLAVAGTLFAACTLPAAAQSPAQISASLSSDASFVSWLGNSAYIASQADEKGTVYYKVDAQSKKAVELIPAAENANAVCAAGDGSVFAYTNDAGKIVIIGAYANQRKELSVDNAVKSDLNLSAYGGELFYINDVGGSENVLDAVTRGNSAPVTLVSDAKKFKTDLNVNGDYAVYLLSLSGSVSQDKPTDETNATDVNVTVATKGTEPQLYLIDTTMKSKGGKKMTSTDDSKVSPTVSNLGAVAYVSVDADGNTKLMYMPRGGSWMQVANGYDVEQCEFDAAGSLIFSANDADGNKSLYRITGNAEPIKAESMGDASEFSISPDASHIALFGGSQGIGITQSSSK